MQQQQPALVDLATPLHQVTFVVVDLETTGGSPDLSAITEIGAVKLRGGECLGTFQTLVNPGVGIPPEITYLTGITEAMVTPAPRIEAVLPALLEFVGSGTVVVGHNVRFDLAFLRHALMAQGYPRLAHQFIDTCALARRLVREEVPNCKLSTLADYFRLATRPTHRALADARATGELLHRLLERAGSMGVTALDDLLALPTVRGHPQLAKLRLAALLPRRPGVYVFRDAGGRPLYVGKAVDLRRRVRSYFSGDTRRNVGQLLRELAAIDHIETGGELEAAVVEVRLIHELNPRFNRQSKRWRRYAYLKLTLNERFPRLSVVRSPRPGDGCLYVGPMATAAVARAVADAVESVVPLRRCRQQPSLTRPRAAPCTPAQLGVASCPCAGAITVEDYRGIVTAAVRALTSDPSIVLGPLAARIRALAGAGRFEEAADVRDRAAAFARALARQRRMDGLRRAGRVTLDVAGEGPAVLDHGRLITAVTTGRQLGDADSVDGPVPRELADELTCVAAFLQAKAERIRVIECSGELASPLPPVPHL